MEAGTLCGTRGPRCRLAEVSLSVRAVGSCCVCAALVAVGTAEPKQKAECFPTGWPDVAQGLARGCRFMHDIDDDVLPACAS